MLYCLSIYFIKLLKFFQLNSGFNEFHILAIISDACSLYIVYPRVNCLSDDWHFHNPAKYTKSGLSEDQTELSM